jgi:PIN domain nuclease of toxin-antitoxin system
VIALDASALLAFIFRESGHEQVAEKSPDIPSLLVETAYITNPREERKLINPAYQQALAHAMINGIRIYFKQNALRTLFVAR